MYVTPLGNAGTFVWPELLSPHAIASSGAAGCGTLVHCDSTLSTSAPTRLRVIVPAAMFAPLRFSNPAPLPLKMPLKVLAGLEKLVWPVNVWLPLRRATLLESRASASVPVRFAAFW